MSLPLNVMQAYVAMYGAPAQNPPKWLNAGDRLEFYTPSGLTIGVPLHFPNKMTEHEPIYPPRVDSPLTKTVGGYCEVYQRPSKSVWDANAGDSLLTPGAAVPDPTSQVMWFYRRETTGGGTRSCGYNTRAEAVTALAAQIWFFVEHVENLVSYMRAGDRTPRCGHVSEQAVIRCQSTHYTLGEEPSQSAYRTMDRSLLGYGGRCFRFKMLTDDRIIESHNVWCQGEIPLEYRSILTDNALVYEGE